jgi:hypothetical protein
MTIHRIEWAVELWNETRFVRRMIFETEDEARTLVRQFHLLPGESIKIKNRTIGEWRDA